MTYREKTFKLRWVANMGEIQAEDIEDVFNKCHAQFMVEAEEVKETE